MERYRGKSVSPNIAIGRIWFYEKKNARLKKERLVTRLRNGNGMRMPETQHEIN